MSTADRASSPTFEVSPLMVRVTGEAAVMRRLSAISNTEGFMRQLGLRAVREQKLIVRRKTGNLGRSIGLGPVTQRSVTTVARANYAGFVEHGTRPHTITPRAAKALRFAASPGGRRLSGAPRTGAAVAFAKVVHHPGTRPYPYMVPGAMTAARKQGVGVVINEWNEAA